MEWLVGRRVSEQGSAVRMRTSRSAAGGTGGRQHGSTLGRVCQHCAFAHPARRQGTAPRPCGNSSRLSLQPKPHRMEMPLAGSTSPSAALCTGLQRGKMGMGWECCCCWLSSRSTLPSL